jgi:hydrogenase nickel incorporation protein HypB
MHPFCSCGGAAPTQHQLAANDQLAAHNRTRFDNHGVLAINLMSSTAAGKAALLDATIVALGNGYRIAVIEGNHETDDVQPRAHKRGKASVRIRTAPACHLRANLVPRGQCAKGSATFPY